MIMACEAGETLSVNAGSLGAGEEFYGFDQTSCIMESVFFAISRMLSPSTK